MSDPITEVTQKEPALKSQEVNFDRQGVKAVFSITNPSGTLLKTVDLQEILNMLPEGVNRMKDNGEVVFDEELIPEFTQLKDNSARLTLMPDRIQISGEGGYDIQYRFASNPKFDFLKPDETKAFHKGNLGAYGGSFILSLPTNNFASRLEIEFSPR